MPKNKDYNPIFYKNLSELDKPISVLVDEIRRELSVIRGKFHDIVGYHGFEDSFKDAPGFLTFGISALYIIKERFEKLEKK